MGASFRVGAGILRTFVAALAMVLSPAVTHAGGDNDAGFAALRAGDARVAAVGHALASRNLDKCDHASAPLSGLTLHALSQYHTADRPAVTRLFGMTRWPGVMAVVPGSAADRAGILEDDQIVAVAGADMAGDLGRATGRAVVEVANRTIADALASGPASLTLLRRGERIEIMLHPVSGCASDIELLSNDAVNAWANGRNVMIGGGLLDRCESDDDLALVIAHEMAHNIIDAQARAKRHRAVRGQASETAADALAVKMMITAGYDPAQAIRSLSRLMQRRGVSFSHPAPTRRIAALQAAMIAARP